MYPIVFTIQRPEKTSRLKMIFRPFLLIPVVFWAGLYSIPVSFVQFLAFWVILFTGSCPKNMWDYILRYYRFATRINWYYALMTDVYPPYNGREDTPYPLSVRVAYPEHWSRLAVFFRWLILFPHFIIVVFYGIGYACIAFINFWAVLFTGRIPDGLYTFMRDYLIYTSRLNGYIYLLVDEYPPFNGSQPQAAAENIQ